jgi:hypothetical protein
MSGYLIRLAGRSLGLIDVLRPRTISMFEPLPDDEGHTFEDNFWLSASFNDPISDSAEPGESRADSNRQAPNMEASNLEVSTPFQPDGDLKIQMQPAAFVRSPSPQQSIPLELGREGTKASPSSEVSPITPSIRQTPLNMDQIPRCSPSGPSCTSSCERPPNELMGRENNPGSARVKVHPYEAKTSYAGDSPNPLTSAQGILESSNGINSKDRDGSVRISGSEPHEAHRGPSAGSSDSLRSSSAGDTSPEHSSSAGAKDYNDNDLVKSGHDDLKYLSLKNPSEANPGAVKGICIPNESDTDRSYLSRESKESPSNISSMGPGGESLRETVPISEVLESNGTTAPRPSRPIFDPHLDCDRSEGIFQGPPLELEISNISSAKHAASYPEPGNRKAAPLAGQRYDEEGDGLLGRLPALSRSSQLSSSKEPIKSVADGVLQRQGPDAVTNHQSEPASPGKVSPLNSNEIDPSPIIGDNDRLAWVQRDKDEQSSRSSSMRPSILASADSQRRMGGCKTQDCPAEMVDADWNHPLYRRSSFRSDFQLPKREDTKNETANGESTKDEANKVEAMIDRAVDPTENAYAGQIPSKSDPGLTEAMVGAAYEAIAEKPHSGIRRVIADLGMDSPALEQEYLLPNRRSSGSSPETVFVNHNVRLPRMKASIKRASAIRSKIPESGTSPGLESFKKPLGNTEQTAIKRRQIESNPLSPPGFHSIGRQISPLHKFERAMQIKGPGRKRKAEIFQDGSLSVGSFDQNSSNESHVNKGSNRLLISDIGAAGSNPPANYFPNGLGAEVAGECSCDMRQSLHERDISRVDDAPNVSNSLADRNTPGVRNALGECNAPGECNVPDSDNAPSAGDDLAHVYSTGDANNIIDFLQNIAADRPANVCKKIVDHEGAISGNGIWNCVTGIAKKKSAEIRTASTEEMRTAVHITVGRIEIRATALNGPEHTIAGSSSRPRSTSSRLTLDSYLKQRSKGQI